MKICILTRNPECRFIKAIIHWRAIIFLERFLKQTAAATPTVEFHFLLLLSWCRKDVERSLSANLRTKTSKEKIFYALFISFPKATCFPFPCFLTCTFNTHCYTFFVHLLGNFIIQVQFYCLTPPKSSPNLFICSTTEHLAKSTKLMW